jgi:hypothetical protein
MVPRIRCGEPTARVRRAASRTEEWNVVSDIKVTVLDAGAPAPHAAEALIRNKALVLGIPAEEIAAGILRSFDEDEPPS